MKQRALFIGSAWLLVSGSAAFVDARVEEVRAECRARGVECYEGTPEVVAPVVAR